jgi:hypothetical protein
MRNKADAREPFDSADYYKKKQAKEANEKPKN